MPPATEPQSAPPAAPTSPPELVLVCDDGGLIRWASGSTDVLLGRPASGLVDVALRELLHPVDRDPLGGPAGLPPGGGAGDGRVLRFRRADGTWLPLRVTSVDLPRGGGSSAPSGAVLITGFDFAGPPIAGDLAAERAVILERIARGAPVLGTLEGVALGLSRRLGHVGVIIGLTDEQGVLRRRVTGVPAELVEALDQTTLMRPHRSGDRGAARLAPPTVRQPAVAAALVAGASGGALQGCWVVDVAAGSGPAARLVVLHPDPRAPAPYEAALVERAADLVAVALERVALRSRLERQRHRDELTGLANRHQLVHTIREALASDPAAGLGIVACDVDGFRAINDSLGPEAGDHLLCEVARRFSSAVRPGDLVARVGPDDFVVLCPGVTGEAELSGVADRLAGALREPIVLGPAPIVASIGCGLARATGPTDPALLLRDADLALRAAKEQGRGVQARHTPELRARAVARLDVELALRDAVRRQEMRLAYQPIVSLADGGVRGLEALLRWERPGIGPVAPADFVPLATEIGLILPIGRWAIDRAVAEAVEWGGISVSVNLSARQLADPDLVAFVADALARHGLPPELLCLEVTESDLAVEPVPSAAVLGRLAAAGVRLAIDDFGTGFATLDYLRRYSMADEIKVDASFVAGLDELGGPDLPIVSAALLLARNLGFETVAEGVETAHQREVLRRLGCDRGQGHLFSEPLSSAQVPGWLATALHSTTPTP